ncbi:hypothetical protein HanRHA438_Chr15g0686321 [Helianthus annuus]|uniref:Uncharacterized protein n=1 Tax=Helianthus annuus TaxID=4232 RepID=A0A251S4Z2_HELAN|nr:hypothetical protein HanXRQr2_Chr15g0673891 [Helianthus annuus]KAJ0471600.1 hypothetical protein HanHA89_Chr15g0597881 [Helianthus annuus]KAJ0647229.1 hypothetical protein HanLR1_Chr15g0559541 [Helianthus annuus]KAJ0651119.1 hypothetical protein HanOQP8_Chr15g0557541 [Helianthus annuus]KAJ0829698.1 hypothetical protein HanPSC8_Chr15g0646741 [Helianthus annuus]
METNSFVIPYISFIATFRFQNPTKLSLSHISSKEKQRRPSILKQKTNPKSILAICLPPPPPPLVVAIPSYRHQTEALFRS